MFWLRRAAGLSRIISWQLAETAILAKGRELLKNGAGARINMPRVTKTALPIIDEPLVPADADLRDLPGFILETERFLNSDLMDQSGDTVKLAMSAWCAAWHHVPAGTLPDNDVHLAKMLGYGRHKSSINAWRSDRARIGLYGWLKCSKDGLLYHPVLSEKVLEALASKQSRAAKTEPAREAAKAARESAKQKKEELRRLRESIRRQERDQEWEPERYGPPAQPLDITGIESLSQTGDRLCSVSVPDSVTGPNIKEGKVREEELASSAREAEVSVVPSGGVLPGMSGSTVAFVSEQLPDSKPVAADVFDRARMPRLCDPPNLWIGSVSSASSKDDWGIARPDVDGWHVDVIAKEVCDAAGMDRADWKGDWWVLCRWLRDGFRPSHIISAITERRGRFGDRWRPPDTLRGLDRVVREYNPKRSAA